MKTTKKKNDNTSNNLWGVETKRFLRSKQWNLARHFTFQHFDKKCINCGSTDNIHLDHIIARVNDNKGIKWLDMTNLQPLCCHCNSKVKGTKNTDYRSDAHIAKCIEIKPLFEKLLLDNNLDVIWNMWEKSTNHVVVDNTSAKNKTRSDWKIKIRRCVKGQMTYDEIKKYLNIVSSTPDYKYIDYYITYLLSDTFKSVKQKRLDKRKRNKFNKKQKDVKMKMLDDLYRKRHKLSKEQLIKSIELIATTI